jgi:mannose-binding lectin 2
VNNGSLHYDHDNDGIGINLAGCEASIRGRDVDSSIAIRYQNDRLTISTDVFAKDSWTECFSIDNIQLPTHYYFGFSAATGELSDNHDIIMVHTYQLESTEPRASQDRKSIIPSAPLNKTDDIVIVNPQTSSWSALKIFFLVTGLIIICVFGIGVYYYTRNRRRGPRFY